MVSQNAGAIPGWVQVLLGDDPEAAVAQAEACLGGGMDPVAFLQTILTPAMQSIGEMFGRLDIYLPELISAAESAQAISGRVIMPRLEGQRKGAVQNRGTVLLGTVRGDLHDIGKNMVRLMLEVNGFEVVDAGVDVGPREFVDRAAECGAQIVALSALMTTSMPYMKQVVEMRDGLGHKGSYFVVVGGAPLTPAYAEEIGADGFGASAVEAVELCLALLARPGASTA